MQRTHWNTRKIAQYNRENKQALLFDEQTLVSFSQDFGKLKKSSPLAVYIPETTADIQNLLAFARQHVLPLTIRGKGLSQNGQALPVTGGITLSMQKFDHVEKVEENLVWVEANASWSSVLDKTLPENKAPRVLPYNCDLSVAGVLSAGGIGATSFKYGPIAANVAALEVIDGEGQLHQVDAGSDLFHACLGGQGRFGLITRAAIPLRPVAGKVKTFCLVYDNMQAWFADAKKMQKTVDFMELFCSPSIQGMQLTRQGRKPLIQWLYGLHLTLEYGESEPLLPEGINPWKILHAQKEGMDTFLRRHDARFEAMKQTGLWDLIHPWYECFVPSMLLREHLESLLDKLPLPYASLVHIVPVARKEAGFFQFPEGEDISAFMILNPGIGEALKASCLKTMQDLDDFFLTRGGKRYLSGYLGAAVDTTYWQQHFGSRYAAWQTLKAKHDPLGLFSSLAEG